jgi:SNF2 family DNA or RNA helicase
MHNEKVGHIKATMAKNLAPIMDDARGLRVRLDGVIPRSGNAYTLPISIEFYSIASTPDLARKAAIVLGNKMKRDYQFHLAREFGGDGVSENQVAQSSKPIVVHKKLDWNAQQKALDEMFDKQLEDQYKNLPDILMPACLTNITLFDYQIQGIKWLVKKETSPSPAPFYKQVVEKGKQVYLCDITNASQQNSPKGIKGSLLCDQMGLGKSVQTIGLILLAPPEGIEYKVNKAIAGNDEDTIPMPEEKTIRAANASTLKAILKTASLKVSGKKQDLIDRILDAQANDKISGEHFPISMRPVASTTSRCTLIVCPVSVMGNWTHQVRSYVTPGVLNVSLYHGPKRNEILQDVKVGTVDILLVSYQTLAAEFSNSYDIDSKVESDEPQKKRARRDSIFDIDFHRIVLDEAVRISCQRFIDAIVCITCFLTHFFYL